MLFYCVQKDGHLIEPYTAESVQCGARKLSLISTISITQLFGRAS